MRIFYWSWLCMKMLIFGLVIAIVVISGCTGNIDRSTKEVYQAKGTMVNITSGNMTYPAYLAAPSEEARKPAIVLVHSNRGLEPGYRNLTDRLASEGYIVLALQWQTFVQRAGDETIELLLRSSEAYLRTSHDVGGKR